MEKIEIESERRERKMEIHFRISPRLSSLFLLFLLIFPSLLSNVNGQEHSHTFRYDGDVNIGKSKIN